MSGSQRHPNEWEVLNPSIALSINPFHHSVRLSPFPNLEIYIVACQQLLNV